MQLIATRRRSPPNVETLASVVSLTVGRLKIDRASATRRRAFWWIEADARARYLAGARHLPGDLERETVSVAP
jgi:hypothetical protein